MTRPAFIYELQDIMKEHSLTLNQTVQLLALLHGITGDVPASDQIVLMNKRLLKPGNEVDIKILFRRREDKQLALKMNFSTDAKGTDDTLKLAHNLEKEFVLDVFLTDAHRKEVADKFFSGDLTIARYFTIFKSLFPRRGLKSNKKWNKHFRITYDDSDRWSSSYIIPKKFEKLFKKKDIGLLLMGLYFAIKDGIDYDAFKTFVIKPQTFLENWEQWYELAETKLEDVKEAEEHPEKQL